MNADQLSGTNGSSNAVARQRDQILLWLTERHPVTVGMLVEIGLFPTRKKASRRLHRLMHRRQLRCLGSVWLKDGRPEHVYGRGRWMQKVDTLLHEVLITQVCLKTDAEEIRRNPNEVDRLLRPDAELFIRGQRYLLEMDRGTMAVGDVVHKRFAKYRGCREFVLWVCPTPQRLERLRQQAGPLREIVLFTTLDRFITEGPHAPIWIDVTGATAALPRGVKGGE